MDSHPEKDRSSRSSRAQGLKGEYESTTYIWRRKISEAYLRNGRFDSISLSETCRVRQKDSVRTPETCYWTSVQQRNENPTRQIIQNPVVIIYSHVNTDSHIPEWHYSRHINSASIWCSLQPDWIHDKWIRLHRQFSQTSVSASESFSDRRSRNMDTESRSHQVDLNDNSSRRARVKARVLSILTVINDSRGTPVHVDEDEQVEVISLGNLDDDTLPVIHVVESSNLTIRYALMKLET